MVKKDKKSKTAEQKARVAAKQGKKAAQKEKKVKSKGAEDSDAEDIDLESVLAEYAKQVHILSLSSDALIEHSFGQDYLFLVDFYNIEDFLCPIWKSRSSYSCLILLLRLVFILSDSKSLLTSKITASPIPESDRDSM